MTVSRLSAQVSVTAEADPIESGVPRIPLLIAAGSASEGGRTEEQRLQLIDKGLEIGRRPEGGSGVRTWTVSDRHLSGRHARVMQAAPGIFEVSDLGSTNGTLMDGLTVTEPVPLRDGALLFFGGMAAVFRLLTEEAILAIKEELQSPLGPVPTASASLALALRKLRRLGPTMEEVLLIGETGVGKEVFARSLHRTSGRKGSFVALNCAALPHELVESELFGYARGAHSQAAKSKAGLIEQADGGTLFLDEIGEMPPSAQAKLLRFLQEREFIALGDTAPRRLDVRVVAATRHVGETVQGHGLRPDLAARLGAEPIILPPLRKRPEDIGPLARHFLDPTREIRFETPAFLALGLYGWPRNVRELEKTMREALVYAQDREAITLEHLPSAVRQILQPSTDPPTRPPHRPPSQPVKEPTTEPPAMAQRRSPRPPPAREELEELLRRHQGNVADVARELDRQWNVVWRWIVKYGIDVEGFKG